MKRNLVVSLMLLVMIVLTGCGKTHNEDIVKKYKDYWDYSLGKYEVTSEIEDDNGGGSGGLTWNTYSVYTFKFKDENGLNKSISISNYYTDFNDEINFAAAEILEKELQQELEKHDFSKMNQIAYIGNDSPSIYIYLAVIDSSKKLYDSKTGVNFRKINLKNASDYNFKKHYSTSMKLRDKIENIPNIKEILQEEYGFILDGNSNDRIEFVIYDNDNTKFAHYYLTYDGFNYMWEDINTNSSQNN